MNTIDEKVEVVPYNSEWPKHYASEKLRLMKKLDGHSIFLEHIGSTAVEGMCAKPIIDIMLGAENSLSRERIVPILIGLGYECLGEAGIVDRIYLRKRVGQSFNIALVQKAGNIWNQNIKFRDFLRNHKCEAETYSKLKMSIISNGGDTLLTYSKLKSSYIEIFCRINIVKK